MSRQSKRAINVYTATLHLVVVAVVVCTAGTVSGWEQPPAKSARDLDVEVSVLKLSQMCSTAAETFWRRGGYDHPSTPAKGTTETWSYQSHYSAEQKRCFVLVAFLSLLPSGGSTRHQEVFDAIEGGEPLAILNTLRFPPGGSTDVVTLLKENAAIPTTPDNLAWFRGLMSK